MTLNNFFRAVIVPNIDPDHIFKYFCIPNCEFTFYLIDTRLSQFGDVTNEPTPSYKIKNGDIICTKTGDILNKKFSLARYDIKRYVYRVDGGEYGNGKPNFDDFLNNTIYTGLLRTYKLNHFLTDTTHE